MSGYRLLRLDEVADVTAGDPAPQDPQAFASDGPLFIRMQDVGRHHLHPALSDSVDRLNPDWLAENRLRLFPKGSVLIPKSGASVNLNHRAKLATDAYVVSHLAVLTAKRSMIDPDFLYWWSARFDPRAQAQVTSLPSLKLATLKNAAVPLPPLDEQRRIVDILNRAARIEALRRRAAERLREFVPALFVKMFGDPVENPMGWPTGPLGIHGHLDRGRSRHRPRNAPELYGGPHPFVQTGDVANSNGIITHYSQTYSDTGLNQSKMWPRGTLCITIAANIGMTGILAFDSCFPDSIVGFQPGKTVTVEYVQSALDLMQQRLESDAPRAAQRNINLGTLRQLTIPIPQLSLQRRYSAAVQEAHALARVGHSASTIAATLMESLMFELLHVRAFASDSTSA